MRVSKALASRWRETGYAAIRDIVIDPKLGALLAAPLLHRGNCVLLSPLTWIPARREDYPDDTGFEAYVNKIHVSDFIDEASVDEAGRVRRRIEQGVKYVLTLAERLTAQGTFRIILSLDTESGEVTVRFFTLRGEAWGPDDPEACIGEEMLIVDTQGAGATGSSGIPLEDDPCDISSVFGL